MNQRMKRRVGKRLAQDLETFLAAAHPGQPIVNQRHPQPGERPRTRVFLESFVSELAGPRACAWSGCSGRVRGPARRMLASMPALREHDRGGSALSRGTRSGNRHAVPARWGRKPTPE